MHDSRAREVIRMSDAAFKGKQQLDILFQEIALNFYPERADFTSKRHLGSEFSDHLYSSYPTLARQELGNLISSNLRPQSQKWFSNHVDDEEVDKGHNERKFLEHLSNLQWRGMYDPKAHFVKATKQCDQDFAAFGNGVIHISLNSEASGMLYKNYHLRDCAWTENADGEVDCLYRRWNPTARQLVRQFGDEVSKEVKKCMKKEPEKVFPCIHVLMPMLLYNQDRKTDEQFRYVSLYVEVDQMNVLEEAPQAVFTYAVPRWQTVSGSQYGSSMATTVALPDGRTHQVITRTLREAGEKYVDPPMIAIGDAIRGDIPLYAGGITIADMEYDERLGEVLRPISQQSGNMPIGFEISAAIRDDIRSAFFADKIKLPDPGNADMTAFEVRRRLEEHIRGAAPLFEPIEKDYNMPVCEITFEVMRNAGAFPMAEMPETLEGRDVKFTFRSPLAEMADQNEAEIYKAVMAEVFMPAAEIDPSLLSHIDIDAAIRDAAKASGFKEEWLKDIKDVQKAREVTQQQAAKQAQMAEMQEMASMAEQGGKGLNELKKAQE